MGHAQLLFLALTLTIVVTIQGQSIGFGNPNLGLPYNPYTSSAFGYGLGPQYSTIRGALASRYLFGSGSAIGHPASAGALGVPSAYGQYNTYGPYGRYPGAAGTYGLGLQPGPLGRQAGGGVGTNYYGGGSAGSGGRGNVGSVGGGEFGGNYGNFGRASESSGLGSSGYGNSGYGNSGFGSSGFGNSGFGNSGTSASSQRNFGASNSANL